jgi:hypothetical protein
MVTGNGANGSSGIVEQVQGTASQLAGQATDTAGQLVGQAKEQAKPALQGQKERAAVSVGSTAEALRKGSQYLREQDQAAIARYVDEAADRVERFGGYLRGHDLDQLVVDAEQVARRQPGLFLGGAFAFGLLGARLLKSSGQRAQAAARQQSIGTPPYRPAGYGNAPVSSMFAQAHAQSRPAGSSYESSNQASEPGWTSRDERAAAGLSGTSGYAAPATDGRAGSGARPDEVAP